MGTNFSEWVQIFQNNVFREEPILEGSKLNVTVQLVSLYVFVCFIIENVSQTLSEQRRSFLVDWCEQVDQPQSCICTLLPCKVN